MLVSVHTLAGLLSLEVSFHSGYQDDFHPKHYEKYRG